MPNKITFSDLFKYLLVVYSFRFVLQPTNRSDQSFVPPLFWGIRYESERERGGESDRMRARQRGGQIGHREQQRGEQRETIRCKVIGATIFVCLHARELQHQIEYVRQGRRSSLHTRRTYHAQCADAKRLVLYSTSTSAMMSMAVSLLYFHNLYAFPEHPQILNFPDDPIHRNPYAKFRYLGPLVVIDVRFLFRCLQLVFECKTRASYVCAWIAAKDGGGGWGVGTY